MTKRLLSEQPAALRQRRRRERLKTNPGVTVTRDDHASNGIPQPVTAAPVENASRVTSQIPIHDTQAVTGDKSAWTSAPTLAPTTEGAAATPIATAAPVAPAAPVTTTPEEAAVIGKAVAGYVGYGTWLLVARNAGELGKLAQPEQLQAYHKVYVAFVEQSAVRFCMKHNIRIPWQDEIVVASGVGLATVGIFGGKPKNDNKSDKPIDARSRDVTPPKRDPNGGLDGADEEDSVDNVQAYMAKVRAGVARVAEQEAEAAQ